MSSFPGYQTSLSAKLFISDNGIWPSVPLKEAKTLSIFSFNEKIRNISEKWKDFMLN